jgi:peroxiredoxin Q/BCP
LSFRVEDRNMLDIGDPAPEFALQDQDGTTVALSDFEGQRILLYFFPKAMTPGCETQARRFRDLHGEFRDLEVAVVGVSPDPVDKLAEFAAEENLPFPLLSDPDGGAAEAYESHGEKRLRGVMREMTLRNSYLIGPDGTIEAAYESVMPYDHPPDVLDDLAEMEEPTT